MKKIDMDLRTGGWGRMMSLGGASALLAATLGFSAAAPAAVPPDMAPDLANAPRIATHPESRSFTLKDLGANEPVTLKGIEHQIDFPVAIRDDEVVTGAKLHLRFGHSPSLIWEWSHLTVLVNNEVVGNVAMTAATAGGTEVVVPIDPRTLVGYSQLGLRAVMHYTKECEDPTHSTLWAKIANDSKLDLEVSPLSLAGDLALLPGPFFDPHDKRHLRLPIVLPASPTHEEIESAGMIASWFGAMAEYRGADFPVYLGSFPAEGHAVVVGTHARVASGVAVAKATGAQIAIAPNPSDPNGRLLVVSGDDGANLLSAARALTLGKQALTGPSSSIRDLTVPELRKAYDAPRWVPTDRVVQLGERVTPDQLQVRGQYVPPIRVPWDLAPDLFYWKSKGAFMDLRYRYTPIAGAQSTLDVDVNGEFARGIPIPPQAMPTPEGEQIKLPESSFPEVAKREEFYIPGYRFVSDNELRFQYNFEIHKKGLCEDIRVDFYRGAIDPESSVDLTRLPHFTYLPDLKLFANGSFPFSKYADLAQTIAVLPAQPAVAEIETFLDAMGHIGNSTGYPATRVRVTDPSLIRNASDSDLLVIGSPDRMPLLHDWAKDLPMTVSDKGVQLRVPGPVEGIAARFQGRDLKGAAEHAGKVIVDAGKMLGAMMSFQSPLSASRTVVVITAIDSTRLTDVARSLDDPGRNRFIGGDLALFNGTKTPSHYALAPQYSVGHLPFFTGIRYWFSRQPLILSILTIFLAVILAFVLYRLLRTLASRRREGR